MTDRKLLELAAIAEPPTNQCGETCERAKLCAVCARGLMEPVEEPVAWRTFDGEGGWDYRSYDENENYAAEWAKRNPHHLGWVEPLYTAPPQRLPLTDEEIWNDVGIMSANSGYGATFETLRELIRAIEAAYGIGSKT